MRRISFLPQTIGLLSALSMAVPAVVGCEQSDLGRYCITGQPIPPCSPYCCEQPTLLALNLQAPECQDRLCLQQGPFVLHQANIDDPTLQCDESWCSPPYKCDPAVNNKCAYTVKAVCTRECTKHGDCKRGPNDANGKMCTKYVCHKQASGEAFDGHCLCVCKDFLVNPESDPPGFFQPEDTVDEPQGCR